MLVVYRRFTTAYLFHIQGSNTLSFIASQVIPSCRSCTYSPQLRADFLFVSKSHANSWTAGLWTWRHFDPSKRRLLFISINSGTSKNTRIFRNTALKPQIFQGVFSFNYDLGLMLWTRNHWFLYICVYICMSWYSAPVLCSCRFLLERSPQVHLPTYCSFPSNLNKNIRALMFEISTCRYCWILYHFFRPSVSAIDGSGWDNVTGASVSACHPTVALIALSVVMWRSLLLHLLDLFFLLESVWFQASSAVQLRSSLLWDVTQRVVVVIYRRFGTTCRSPEW